MPLYKLKSNNWADDNDIMGTQAMCSVHSMLTKKTLKNCMQFEQCIVEAWITSQKLLLFHTLFSLWKNQSNSTGAWNELISSTSTNYFKEWLTLWWNFSQNCVDTINTFQPFTFEIVYWIVSIHQSGRNNESLFKHEIITNAVKLTFSMKFFIGLIYWSLFKCG